ncbi:MAG TPA: CopG family transcriptional regulator [Desulfatiglandales bacterium]|nr:CopG family transcriptional regulator [Desulfatiglandales bacterium]
MPKRTNIYLPEEQIKRLKDISKKKDISVSELIRRAIEDYLKREEKKV